MAIDPLSAAGIPRTDAQRTDSAAAGEAVKPAGHAHHGHKHAAAADQLELSIPTPAAGADGEIPTGTLSPDRLREVTQRLAAGTYDTPAIADAIAGKLISNGEV